METVQEFKLVDDNKVFRFKNLCPYCKSDLVYRVTGWTQNPDNTWSADMIESECQSFPGYESEDFEDWLSNHSIMPYVYQLPVDQQVKKYINERYRFKV